MQGIFNVCLMKLSLIVKYIVPLGNSKVLNQTIWWLPYLLNDHVYIFMLIIAFIAAVFVNKKNNIRNVMHMIVKFQDNFNWFG